MSAINANLKDIRSMQEINEEERIEAENKVTIHKDTSMLSVLKSKNDRLNNIIVDKNKYACVAESVRRCRKVGN